MEYGKFYDEFKEEVGSELFLNIFFWVNLIILFVCVV